MAAKKEMEKFSLILFEYKIGKTIWQVVEYEGRFYLMKNHRLFKSKNHDISGFDRVEYVKTMLLEEYIVNTFL